MADTAERPPLRRTRPVLIAAGGLLSGIIIGNTYTIPVLFIYPLFAFLVLLAIYFFAKGRGVPCALFFICCLVLGAGRQEQVSGRFRADADLIKEHAVGGPILIRGIIADVPNVKNSKKFILIKPAIIESETGIQNLYGKVRVTLELNETGSDYLPGDIVSIPGRLLPNSSPRNPGEFDYAGFFRSRGISAAAAGLQPELVTSFTPEDTGILHKLQRLLAGGRSRLYDWMEASFTGPEKSLLEGLLFGTKNGIAEDMMDDFRAAGLAHLLAVSGLHIGILTVALYWLFRIIMIPDRAAWLLTLPFIFCYAAISGFAPSVNRAALMFLIMILGKLTGRPVDMLHSLSLAAIIILLINPLAVSDISFQFSYLAVLGIALGLPAVRIFRESSPIYRRCLRFCVAVPGGFLVWPLFNKVLMALVISVLVQVLIAPLCLYNFWFWNPLAPLTGALAALLAIFLLPLSLFGGIIHFIIPALDQLIIQGVKFGLSLLLKITTVGTLLPGAFINGIIPGPGALIIYYLLAWLFLLLFQKRLWDLTGPSVRWLYIPLAFILWLSLWPLYSDKDRLTLWQLDIGQGDCAFIDMPRSGNMLIDTGPSGRSGGNTRRVISFLHSQGVERIDCLVISHPDSDHYGGTPYLMDEFEIGLLLHNGSAGRSRTYKQILEDAESKNIEVRSLASGDRITGFEDVDIEVIGPVANVPGGPRDDNNRSVVLLVKHGRNRFLFTGDILQDGQRLLNRAGLTPGCDILKVPHHGDNGAAYEPFLNRVKPSLGIISAGVNNAYGHPDPYTLRMYERKGIPVLRTDRSGAIRIISDGEKLYARPFIQEKMY